MWKNEVGERSEHVFVPANMLFTDIVMLLVRNCTGQNINLLAKRSRLKPEEMTSNLVPYWL